MSTRLYLVRHGIAFDAGPRGGDADRALTPAGARKMERTAHGLRRMGVRPDAVLSSPLRRAEQTAQQLHAVLAPEASFDILASLAPGHDPLAVIGDLRAYRGAQQLILVGHLPDIGELASYLLSASSSLVPFDFKKGAVAAIEVASLPPRSPGMLRWFMTSKQLRALALR